LAIAAAIAALLLIVAFSQSVSLREVDQHHPDPDDPAGPPLTTTTSIAQSLTITHDRFETFDFRAAQPQLVYSGKVKLRLLQGGASGKPLNVELIPSGGRVVFGIPDLPPAGQYYLELTGVAADLSAFGVVYSPQDNYSGGQLYVDGQPHEGDLSFHATYRYNLWQGLADAAGILIANLWVLICALLLYILPGRALLALLPRGTLNFAQRIIAAPFLTLAALPLLLLWLKPTGLLLGGWQMWVILIVSAAVIVWDERRRGRVGDGWRAVLGWWAYVLLAGYMVLAIVARLLSAKPLVAGSGIDGYHHTLITQLIMERGQLPSDYLPYAPLSSFTYHYGFHALGAALGWLSGLDSVTLMLLTGQVLSAIIAAALFVFVEYIWHSRVMALAAAFIVGFLAIFPIFYVNWSRYTQLAGLAVLPVAILLLVIALRQPRLHWGSIALAVISGAGLLLVHYRIWITYATLVALYAMARVAGDAWQYVRARRVRTPSRPPPLGEEISTLPSPREGLRAGARQTAPLPSLPPLGAGVEGTINPAPTSSHSSLLTPHSSLLRLPAWIASILVTGTLMLLAVLPWLLNLRANFITRIVNNTNTDVTAGFFDLDTLIGRQPLNYFSSYTLLALAAAGLLLMLWRFNGWGWLLTAWVGLHVLLSNPYWLRLPFAGLVDNVTLVQSSFVLVAIFAGYAVAQIIALAGRLLRLDSEKPPPDAVALLKAARIGLAIITIAGALAATPPQLGLLDAKPYVLAQDRAAQAWIAANVPSNSLFLVSDFGFEWAPRLAQGSDAGLWIPLLARPASNAPPAHTPGSTAPPQPAYNEQLADSTYLTMTFDTTIASTALDKEESWQTLKRYGVTHIYVGSRGGVLHASQLASNPHAVLIWHQDDVWVYRIDYNARLP